MNEALINDWKPETKSLIATLKRHGFEIVKGCNGEEQFAFDGNRAKFLENLLACDEAHLYVKCPKTGRVRWIYLVLGNSPGEIVCDYSVPGFSDSTDADPLDAATQEHATRWDGRKQPTQPNPNYRPVDYVLVERGINKVLDTRRFTFNEAARANTQCYADPANKGARTWLEKSAFEKYCVKGGVK